MKRNFPGIVNLLTGTLITAALFIAIESNAQTAPAAGSGTPADPYQVANFSNLNWISLNRNQWNKHYIQTSDIDASASEYLDNGKGWNPIGRNVNGNYIAFTGIYDGGDFKIKNLHVNRSTGRSGMFGYVKDSTLKNINLENLDMVAAMRTGGVAGHVVNGFVENCACSGTISLAPGTGAISDRVGGVVGDLETSDSLITATVLDCSSSVTVNGESYLGGIVGFNYKSLIERCQNTGAVGSEGANWVGGIVGSDFNATSVVKECKNSGTVNAPGGVAAGGIAGKNLVASLLGDLCV